MRLNTFVAHAAALMGCCIHPAAAVTVVCVNAGDAADFQTKLNDAVTSGVATTLEIPRGIYHLGGNPLVFNATSMSQGQLDITGGYSSDCSTIVKNPAFTVIDGDSLSGVLSLTSTGGISVRYLTIQDGLKDQRAGLEVNASAGGIIIDYNIIRYNRATDQAAGLFAELSGGGDIHIDGNIVANNSANTNLSGSAVASAAGGVYVTNNTVANNIITGPPDNGYGGLVIYAVCTAVSNNIFWGNTQTDISTFASNCALVDNDYETLGGYHGSNTGFQNADPLFAGITDFHLLPTSPVLGAGTLTPGGNLPTIDIEGHPRSYNGLVDMGAYERGDEIFASGFDL